ncbi:hypothetical protein AMK22_04785 [Streptomyces sp. CB01580]|nr:hypothetical protein AMK22_04785 [Streptomyces sp. CB01580]
MITRVRIPRPRPIPDARFSKDRLPGARLLGAALVGGPGLTGCSADGPSACRSDYPAHRPLRVAGHPSTGGPEVVQKAVWRLADGDADGL